MMDLCSQAVFQQQHLQKIQESNTPIAKFLSEKIPIWLNLNRKVFFRKKDYFPWDPVAAAYLIDPTLFDENPYTLSAIETGIRSGKLKNIKKQSSFERQGDLVPLNVPLKLDGDRFMELLLTRLLSL